MIALPPKNPCPKCGNNDWDGPSFDEGRRIWIGDGSYIARDGESLAWTCVTCRYVVRTPCLDANADHVLSS